MRVILGVTALAAASAMLTAVALPSAAATTADASSVEDPTVAPVRHVIRYVQLLPGQTAPPNATVQIVPQPTPRVVVVTTHQSGKK